MFHILLYILKIIGIILISILGILLILTFIILFLPIRYQIEVNKYEEFRGNVKLQWVFHILFLKIAYEKGKKTYQLRVFGFTIKDSDNPKKGKDRKKKTKYKSKRKNTKRKKPQKRNQVTKDDKNNSKSHIEGSVKSVYEKESKNIKENEIQYKDIQQNRKKTGSSREDNPEDFKEISDLENKKTSYWEKLCNIIRRIHKKIKNVFSKICNFFKKLKGNLVEINHTRETLVRQCRLILTFFNEEANKEGVKKIWLTIKKSVTHIFPRKIKGQIHFGTGDPSSTGQLLGIISLTYHYYRNIKIVPDFEEEVLEGNVNARGRIQLFTLAIIYIKLLLDKNFKKLLKSFQELKEEL